MDTAVRTEGRRNRVDRETVVLGVADVAVVAGIVLVGQLSHGASPLAEPLAALESVAPFAVGWLVAALLAGVYARDTSSSLVRTVRVTAVAWIAAANLGLILRASSLFDGGATWPFPLVITGVGLLAVGGWRTAYAAFTGDRS